MLARAPGKPAANAFAGSVAELCATLGGRVIDLELDPAQEDALLQDAILAAGQIDLLVLDGAGLFAAHGADGQRALRACMDCAWSATRALVNHVFLEAQAGRIVYLTPSAEQGQCAAAARAGLENLARTLSIEWARHAITAVAIAPESAACAGEVAALIAYIASPAGAYFSGCVLEVGSSTTL